MKTKPNGCVATISISHTGINIYAKCSAERRPRSMLCKFYATNENQWARPDCQFLKFGQCENKEAKSEYVGNHGKTEMVAEIMRMIEPRVEKSVEDFLK